MRLQKKNFPAFVFGGGELNKECCKGENGWNQGGKIGWKRPFWEKPEKRLGKKMGKLVIGKNPMLGLDDFA